MNFLGSLADKVSSVAGDGVDTIRTNVSAGVDRLPDLPDGLQELKNRLMKQAEEFKEEKLGMLKAFEEEKRNMIKNAIMAKLNAIFDHAFNVAGEHLKDKMKDPYMPRFVQRLIDDLVDAIWPDVKIEAKDVILTGVAPTPVITHGDPVGCPGNMVAFVRHSLYPYNKSIWRKIFECSFKNWFYWLFTLASLVPRFGIGQITYLLLFFFIDKSDEFQLQQYITSFKALQFINLGVLSALIGAVQYYLCTTQVPPTCQSDAPQEELYTVGLFVLQVLFVWIAFCMLGSSIPKGGISYQLEQNSKANIQTMRRGGASILEDIAMDRKSAGADLLTNMHYESEAQVSERSRRRLTRFLVYDMIIFLFCAGLTAWMAFGNLLDSKANVDVKESKSVSNSNWKFTMSLYWIKALYGILSFPFVLLKLPVISSFICHARPTGYNPFGRTVPYLGHPEASATPWNPNPLSADSRQQA